MAAKPRAIGYVRVSTQEQTKGFGLDVQRSAIRAYCKEQGLRLTTIYSDEGISGSNGLDTRVGLGAALVGLERHEAAVLVVYRLDRLARDLVLQETTCAQIRAAGASVASVKEPDIDSSDDPTRTLIRQIVGAVAQYERTLIRARMQAGREAKRSAGGYADGRPRYGYRAEGKQLVPDEREQAAVALARQLRDEGLSLRQIAAHLEVEGFKPKAGDRWQATQVARILA